MRSEVASTFRSTGALLSACVAAALLGACGGGSNTMATGAPNAATNPATQGSPAAAAACTAAPARFTNMVWPEMASSCVTCHAAGRVAGGTALVFNPGGDTQQNYTILRDFVAATGSLVLSKSIGQLSHGGGAPFVDANSQPYGELAALMPVLQQSCAGSTTGGQPAGFWSGVQFSSDAAALAPAAVLFAGRNPTAAESATAAGGPDALRQTIRGFMQGAAFDRFLDEAGMTQFLTLRVVTRGDGGLIAADFPALASLAQADQARFDAAVQREPIELMKFIVDGDRPWTDIVQGNYTVANGVLAQYLGATVQGSFTNPANDSEWRQATIPDARLGGVRDHAGVLSTHAWLDSFPTTATNRNRHRIFILAKQFLATDVAALAQRPIGGPGNFIVPTVENPGCAACHDTIDPMAAGFQNWAENNRSLPFKSAGGKDIALPASYRSSSYPKNAAGQPFYMEGDNWFRDEKAPGYANTPMPGGLTGNNAALPWLGQQVAADSRFALGAVQFWYEAVFGRVPLIAPLDSTGASGASQLAAYNAQQQEFDSIASRFKAGGYRVKDLLTDLVLSQWFRASAATAMSASRAMDLADVGSYNLLLPTQLNLKLASLVGQTWTEFAAPYAGLALTYGDFDGKTRTTRAKDYTMMQAVTIDRLAATRSCAIAKADFDKPAANRLLFPTVMLSDTPATTPDAIAGNVRYLHKWLWKQDVPATDPEVQRTVKLFTDVWNGRATAPTKSVACVYNDTNDANYTGRAWAAVLAYMLGDPQFLYE
jgi:hypothetical protein